MVIRIRISWLIGWIPNWPLRILIRKLWVDWHSRYLVRIWYLLVRRLHSLWWHIWSLYSLLLKWRLLILLLEGRLLELLKPCTLIRYLRLYKLHGKIVKILLIILMWIERLIHKVYWHIWLLVRLIRLLILRALLVLISRRLNYTGRQLNFLGEFLVLHGLYKKTNLIIESTLNVYGAYQATVVDNLKTL